jgi:hypothetical protein
MDPMMMDPMAMPMGDESLDTMAMESMLGPDTGMGGGMDLVDIQVPSFAVEAVMQLISMLEQEMAGGMGADPMGGGMGGGMPPMM